MWGCLVDQGHLGGLGRIPGGYVGQRLTGNTGRLQAVEGFLVAIVQVLAQFSTGVKGQATFREDRGGAISKLACKVHPVVALVPGPPESRHPFTGVDEQDRQGNPEIPAFPGYLLARKWTLTRHKICLSLCLRLPSLQKYEK